MKPVWTDLRSGCRCAAVAAAAILVSACAGCTSTAIDLGSEINPRASSVCQDAQGRAARPHFQRVLIIVFENKDEKEVLENGYFGELKNRGAYLSNFHGLFHPSYSNYLAMVSGKEIPTQFDRQIDIRDAPTIADRLRTRNANLTWKNYAQGYPDDGKCHPKPDFIGRYARKHVPFMSFVAVQERECSNIVPGERFNTDWKDHRLPTYAFFTPDMDNDAHDLPLSAAALWLMGFLEPILSDEQFRKETLVVVTFDESREQSADGGNHIYTLLLGDMVKRGVEISANYNHYSVLRTIEDNFGLAPLADGDCGAKPITEAWIE